MEHNVISSEPFIQKCKSLSKANDLHLEVLDERIRLAWTRSYDGRIDFMERIDTIGLGISYDMLLDALFDVGGSLEANGNYPLNDAMRRSLRKL